MPPKRQRNIRSSKKSSLADWDEPSDSRISSSETAGLPESQGALLLGAVLEDGSKITISDLREVQKLKLQRQRGVDIEDLCKRPSGKARAAKGVGNAGQELESTEADTNNADSAEGPSQQTARSLNGAFTVQTNKLDANKYMMEYIDKEMKKSRGTSNADDAPKGKQDADDIYQVPDHLRIVEAKPLSEGNVAMATKMLTSIQEVDLGKASKLRNIRETGYAVSRISKAESGKPYAGPHAGHGSHVSGTDEGLAMHSRGVDGASSRKRHGDNPDRSNKATDDIVLERFKKRMRR
ncbi:hypothetical protein GGI15_000149 [Coemansia interrupta]|uniref:Uncharacterized protein n=1 Tax=Coemansia interrupta TaxID=1126814 RepID=A0A9W8HTP8_9FUNG|nr:hypothetical protein GGI15_000149 [Coemansia interrupta]